MCTCQISRHERRLSQIDALNDMPLYPTEQILWDENIVPSQYYSGQGMYILKHRRELALVIQMQFQKLSG